MGLSDILLYVYISSLIVSPLFYHYIGKLRRVSNSRFDYDEYLYTVILSRARKLFKRFELFLQKNGLDSYITWLSTFLIVGLMVMLVD